MRKITSEVVYYFNNRQAKKISNTSTDGDGYYLHGNKIAEWRNNDLWITNAGWTSNTTKERLNGLNGVSVTQKNWQWYLNGKEWDGSWVKVTADGFEQPADDQAPEDDKMRDLHTVAMIAQLGEIFGSSQKQKNDWKARMLKAGLGNSGLIMPDDWDDLSEEEKERRLNGAIGAIS